MERTTVRRIALGVAALLLLGGAAYAALRLLPHRDAVPKEGAPWAEARAALDAFDFEQARAALHRCREVWPLNAEAHFLLARVSRLLDDVPAWRKHLHAAEVLQWPVEQVELERLLMRAQAGDVWGVGDKLAAAALSWHPDEVWVVDALVRGNLKAYRVDDADRWITFWLERHPDDWRPHLHRGRMYYQIQAPARAGDEFRRVLGSRPDQPQAHFGLGSALMMQSEFHEAAEHLEQYLRHDPDNADALMALANCQVSLGQRDAARAALDRLFAVRPGDAAGCLLRARMESDPAEALTWLRRAEKQAPHKTDILSELIQVLHRLGREAEADQAARKLHDLWRQNEELDRVKLRILKESGDAALRFEAGTRCRQLGREEEARGWFQSVLALDPSHAAARQALDEKKAPAQDANR